MTVLDQRAATLARLLETHPAVHLLAEYEAVFVDRMPCSGCAVPRHAPSPEDLLDRMDAAIAALQGGRAG